MAGCCQVKLTSVSWLAFSNMHAVHLHWVSFICLYLPDIGTLQCHGWVRPMFGMLLIPYLASLYWGMEQSPRTEAVIMLSYSISKWLLWCSASFYPSCRFLCFCSSPFCVPWLQPYKIYRAVGEELLAVQRVSVSLQCSWSNVQSCFLNASWSFSLK